MESYKIVIVGELAVGKSAIFERMQRGTFPDYSISTLSAHFASSYLSLSQLALSDAKEALLMQA